MFSPFRVSILRDVRTVLYAVSHVSSEYHVTHEHVAEGDKSRLGLHHSRFCRF